MVQHRLAVAHDAMGERRNIIGVQHEVVGDTVAEYQTVFLAIFRDVGAAGLADAARRGPRVILAVNQHAPGAHRAQARDRLDQLGLPIALHSGEAQHFTGAHVKRQRIHYLLAAIIVERQLLKRQHGCAGVRGLLLDLEDHAAPDHHFCQTALAGLAWARLADDTPTAQHHNPVGERQHLAQLMGDEDHRDALRRQRANDHK